MDLTSKNVVSLIVAEMGITAAHILGSDTLKLPRYELPSVAHQERLNLKKLPEPESPLAAAKRIDLVSKLETWKFTANRSELYLPSGVGPEVVDKFMICDIKNLEMRRDSVYPSALAAFRENLTRTADSNKSHAELLLLHDLTHIGYGALPQQILISWYLFAKNKIATGAKYSDVKLTSMGYDKCIFAATPEDITEGISKNREVLEITVKTLALEDVPAAMVHPFESIFDSLAARMDATVSEATAEDVKDTTRIEGYSKEDEYLFMHQLALRPKVCGLSGKMSPELSAFVNYKIKQLAAAGKCRSEIGRTLGISFKLVGDRCAALGITLAIGRRGIPLENKHSTEKPAKPKRQLDIYKTPPEEVEDDSIDPRWIRSELGLTIDEMAQVCGVADRTVIRWEGGKCAAHPDDRRKLQVLSDLLSGETAPAIKGIAKMTSRVSRLRMVVSGGDADDTAPKSSNNNEDSSNKQPEEKDAKFYPATQEVRSSGGVQFKDGIEKMMSGVGISRFYYHKIAKHPKSTPWDVDRAERKLIILAKIEELILKLGL